MPLSLQLRSFIEGELENATDFDGMPIEVQKALFDMVFNLGLTTLRNTFVQFNAAVKKEAWDVAAKQSHRPDVNLDRNQSVKRLLMAAHEKAIAKAVP